MRVYCKAKEGLRASEASITVQEYDGTPQHFPLDRGLVDRVRGRDTIPVRLLDVDKEGGRAFVWLPEQADSGATRIWVSMDALADPVEPYRRGVAV